jgi:hypothetical protein
MRKHLLGGCIALVMFVVPLRAQESRWENLDQIHAGAKVQVVEQNLKSTSGRFVRFSESDLTVNVNNQEIVIPREKVYRVSISGQGRKRHMLIGMAIGAAAGVGVGAAANRVVGDDRVIPGMALAYAGIGAGIGAIVPAAKTAYKAESPRADLQEHPHRE